MKTRQLMLGLFFVSNILVAQVGIGTSTPDSSSILDISSTNKGVLIPKVSLPTIITTQLDGVNTATEGLLIYNTNATVTGGDGVGYYYFTGSRWENLLTRSSKIGLVPIGSIIAWHGSMIGVPSLPDGWMLCDGSQISDTDSPMNFRYVPNLNSNTVSNSGDGSYGRFLRGSTGSGVFQNEQTNNLFRVTVSTATSTVTNVVLNSNGSATFLRNYIGTGSDSSRFYLRGVETRPTSMTVIWIIRIK